MFVFLFLKKKIKSNTQKKNLLVALDNHQSICILRYPKCRSRPAHGNLLWKDHKSLDNLLYLSNLFSVKHRKQILVKHSIKKGRRAGGQFPSVECIAFSGVPDEIQMFPSAHKDGCSGPDWSPVNLGDLVPPCFLSKEIAFSFAEWTQLNL